PEHHRRLCHHHRHRGHGGSHRRLQPDPLRVPRPDPRGPHDPARLHVPAHHHAGAALPPRPRVRPRQLAPRPPPHPHLLRPPLRAVDPPRLLPVYPRGAGPRRPHRRRDSRAGPSLRRGSPPPPRPP